MKIGARGQPIGGGKTLPVGSYYGYVTGIVGLRLFPNPEFDEKAAKNWDPERYYTDPDFAWKALDPGGCSGPDYLKCWKRYWDLTKTDEFKAKMRKIVLAPDFLEDNYLSTDARIPITLLRTNACSPLATNAIRGNIWDNFSSSTYNISEKAHAALPKGGALIVYEAIIDGFSQTRVEPLAGPYSMVVAIK